MKKSPCYECFYLNNCPHGMCSKWMKWFRRTWVEIRVAAGKVNKSVLEDFDEDGVLNG